MTRSGSRPGKGRGDGLSQAAIVEAALTVARRLGLEGFSMRDLAGELGVTQMAAYYYVSSRDELVTLVGNEILSQVRRPGPEVGAWDRQVEAIVTDTVAALRPWRGSGSVMLRTRPPAGVAILDSIATLLRGAGFDAGEARLGTRTLEAWMLGELSIRHLADEAREAVAEAGDAGGSGDGGAGDGRTAVPPAPDISEDDATRFTLGVVLDGLRARLAARQPGAPPEAG